MWVCESLKSCKISHVLQQLWEVLQQLFYSFFWVYLVGSQWDNCCADWVTKAPPSSIPKIASHIFFFSWFWVVTLLNAMVKVSICYTFIDYNSDHFPPPLISPKPRTMLDEGQRWIGKYLKIGMQYRMTCFTPQKCSFPHKGFAFMREIIVFEKNVNV